MPKKFNLNDYDLVQNRIQAFHKEHEDGRIITELMSETTAPLAVFKASIYIGETLKSVGWAMEKEDVNLKTNKYGKEYESVNFANFLENCETSAIGRGLGNMGRHGDKRASREEMEKDQRAKEQYTRACQAIDEKFKDAGDPGAFEEIWKTLQANPKWDERYNAYVQNKFNILMAKENGDGNTNN